MHPVPLVDHPAGKEVLRVLQVVVVDEIMQAVIMRLPMKAEV